MLGRTLRLGGCRGRANREKPGLPTRQSSASDPSWREQTVLDVIPGIERPATPALLLRSAHQHGLADDFAVDDRLDRVARLFEREAVRDARPQFALAGQLD